MRSLNVIGPGRVGRTLAALWETSRTFSLQDVLARTEKGARDGAEFAGAGAVARAIGAMRPADVWMIATPDRTIAECARALAASGLLRAGDIVFHCSGSLASAELSAVASSRASAASVHPLKTFADPADALQSFTGTYCVAEGDRDALTVLVDAFEDIGGRMVEIDARYKTVYHAASVIVCNYLTALMEAGLRCYAKAGLDRATAAAMMEPLVRETIDNVFRLGPARALTGPIARGDDAVVAKHLEALGAWDAHVATLYRELGKIALELAESQGRDLAALERLRALLSGKPLP